MTREAPATALAEAMAAVDEARVTFNWKAAMEDAYHFIRDHGPALAAALRDAERYRWLRKQVEGGNTAYADVYIRRKEESWNETQIIRGGRLDATIDAAISARGDDTPTRGTP